MNRERQTDTDTRISYRRGPNWPWIALALLAMPVTARAGEFPGLVELVLTIMGLAALLLGALTEWVLAVFQERRARWYRGLAYAVIWFLLISMWLWLRSR